MAPPEDIEHFSYATPEDPRLRRLVIRAIETMTGQPYLKSLYEQHRLNPVPGESFWAAAMRNLELKIVCNRRRVRWWSSRTILLACSMVSSSRI
jgi:hypothetical protein